MLARELVVCGEELAARCRAAEDDRRADLELDIASRAIRRAKEVGGGSRVRAPTVTGLLYDAAAPAAEPSNEDDVPIFVIVPSLLTLYSSIADEAKPALSST